MSSNTVLYIYKKEVDVRLDDTLVAKNMNYYHDKYCIGKLTTCGAKLTVQSKLRWISEMLLCFLVLLLLVGGHLLRKYYTLCACLL